MNESPISSYHCVLIEDNIPVQRVTQLLLEQNPHHFEVSAFTTNVSALQLLTRQKVELIVTDKTGNGMLPLSAFVEQLKDTPNASTPVIVISGFDATDDEKDLCDVYLRKPFSMREIDEAVHALLDL